MALAPAEQIARQRLQAVSGQLRPQHARQLERVEEARARLEDARQKGLLEGSVVRHHGRAAQQLGELAADLRPARSALQVGVPDAGEHLGQRRHGHARIDEPLEQDRCLAGCDQHRARPR